LAKCGEVRAMSSRVAIEVDGGVKVETIEKFARAGADTFVSGSGVFNTRDWRASIARMREIAAKAPSTLPPRPDPPRRGTPRARRDSAGSPAVAGVGTPTAAPAGRGGTPRGIF